MNPDEQTDIRVVLYRSGPAAAERIEQRVRLPRGGGLSELLQELKQESPALYEEIRRRILRAAGRVLAFGEDEAFLPTLSQQLAEGGPLIFPAPADDDGCKTTSPT